MDQQNRRCCTATVADQIWNSLCSLTTGVAAVLREDKYSESEAWNRAIYIKSTKAAISFQFCSFFVADFVHQLYNTLLWTATMKIQTHILDTFKDIFFRFRNDFFCTFFARFATVSMPRFAALKILYRVSFVHWYPPKKYGKPRLGETTLT